MVELVNDGERAQFREFDSRAATQIRRNAVASLPIIDFSAYIRDGSAELRRDVAREIRKACVDIGFFYLSGHGFDGQECDAAIAWAHQFFELPMSEKMRVHKRNSPTQQGYMATGGIDPDSNPDVASDMKEVYSLSRERAANEQPQKRLSPGTLQWPDKTVLPGFEDFMRRHMTRRLELSQHLARAFALSLDLPETFFDESHRYPTSSLTLNYYPTLAPDCLKFTQWSISPHTDYGTFTILLQDHLGGLQVRNASGEWIDVPPVPDTFVINLGDLFAHWTNDLYASSLHRAINLSGKARVSIPYFVAPHGAVEIRCLETCTGPNNPPRYEPVLSDDYIAALVRQAFRSGRPGIAVQTADRLTARGE